MLALPSLFSRSLAEIIRQVSGEVGEAMSRWQRIGFEYFMITLGYSSLL